MNKGIIFDLKKFQGSTLDTQSANSVESEEVTEVASEEEAIIAVDNGDVIVATSDIEVIDLSMSIDEDVKELDGVNNTVLQIEKLNYNIKKADDEVKRDGVLSAESARPLLECYNELLSNQGMVSDILNTETALKYPKQFGVLATEGGVALIKSIKENLNKIIKMIIDKVIEYGTKFYAMVDNLESSSIELSKTVTNNYTDVTTLSKDKIAEKINTGAIVGRMSIIDKFAVNDIKEYITYTNNGAPIDALYKLFEKGINDLDLSDFNSLKGISTPYDRKLLNTKELKDVGATNVFPVDITGKSATVLYSVNVEDENKLSTPKLLKMDVKIITTDELKKGALLPRKDIIAIINHFTKVAKEQRNKVKETLGYLNKIKDKANSIKEEDVEFSTNLTRLVGIFTSSILTNAKAGMISNRLVFGTVAEQVRFYNKK